MTTPTPPTPPAPGKAIAAVTILAAFVGLLICALDYHTKQELLKLIYYARKELDRLDQTRQDLIRDVIRQVQQQEGDPG